jgi:hypothetical protein
MRLTPEGALDTSFGTEGFVDWSDAKAGEFQIPGSIVFGKDGSFTVSSVIGVSGNNDWRTGLKRFNDSGAIDSSFAFENGAIPSASVIAALDDGARDHPWKRLIRPAGWDGRLCSACECRRFD